MKQLVFEKLDERAITPTRGHRDDAGFDLHTFGEVEVEPGRSLRLPTYLAVDLDKKMWGLILGRSSTIFKHGLQVMPGVVDPGYKGELLVVVNNVTDEPVQLFDGLRIAQFILMTNVNRRFQPVLGRVNRNSDRGTNGFGSTGAM